MAALRRMISRVKLACICGETDAVQDDDIIGCDSPKSWLSISSHIPNDTIQPPSNEEIVSSLEGVVPKYLSTLSSRPPSLSEFSENDARKLMKEFTVKKTSALQKLHDLTIKAHEYNRIPLIQTDKWNIMSTLSMALIESCDQTIVGSDNRGLDKNRRLICWTLNNLSIPYENKATMILDDKSIILQAMMMVIQLNLPESYLGCIFINNLTFLAEAIKPVALFVPPASTTSTQLQQQAKDIARPDIIRPRSFSTKVDKEWDSEIFENVLGNPSSLLCTIERMMMINAPFLMSGVKSVQGEAIRWACGFVRNVTSGGEKLNSSDASVPSPRGRKGSISNDNIQNLCQLISKTEIPRLIVQFVRDSPHAPVQWTKDSLEDICLGIMCNLARFSSRESLIRAGATECLEKIEYLPGIHGYRARAVRVSLGA